MYKDMMRYLTAVMMVLFPALAQGQDENIHYHNDEASHAFSTVIRHFDYTCPRTAYDEVIHHQGDLIIYKVKCVKEDGADFSQPLLYRVTHNADEGTILAEPWVE